MIEMIFDEDFVFDMLLLPSRRKSISLITPSTKPASIQGGKIPQRYGRAMVGDRTKDRKPTRQEALDRLDNIPFIETPRRLRNRLPLTPYTIPLYAPELAKVFVYLDPLDRIEG